MVKKEHAQTTWNEQLAADMRQLVRLAVAEDLEGGQDWTTVSLVPEAKSARAFVVARVAGVIAGLSTGSTVLDEMDCRATFQPLAADGDPITAGMQVASISGPASEILTTERVILNVLGRLSGIATLTNQYVQLISGTKARVYDTRKTTPGWRRLEKYAVRCGGGMNHRGGLNQAVLIKDNHIAFGRNEDDAAHFGVAEAVVKARKFVQAALPDGERMIIEIEVDSLEQLRQVLPTQPDIVLLDNMNAGQLGQAVALRDQLAPDVELEASGGINLATIREVALAGVDRISVGAITHSAPNLDLGLDWQLDAD